MADLAARNGFLVTATENLGDINASSLSSTSVLMFALTSGELSFDAAQKDAIASFVAGGGGFVGVHSAADTLYGWPEYGRILGAYFQEHPWTQEATVTVEDSGHPTTAGLGRSFRLLEEFYAFRTNPRGMAHVLLSLTRRRSGRRRLSAGVTQTIGAAAATPTRSADTTWRDAGFQNQMVAAVKWAAWR
jgi:type 1 glutamine amidotransferase